MGGPEVLKIREEPSKQPGKGEVRLKVQAVGLNRAELMFMRGQCVEHRSFLSALAMKPGVVSLRPVGLFFSTERSRCNPHLFRC